MSYLIQEKIILDRVFCSNLRLDILIHPASHVQNNINKSVH